MVSCPNCHQSVEIQDKHLGTLFTCPFCNAVYFIDWNGQPEMASHEEEPPFAEIPEFSRQDSSSENPYFQTSETSTESDSPTVMESFQSDNSQQGYFDSQSVPQHSVDPENEASENGEANSEPNPEYIVEQNPGSTSEYQDPNEQTPYDFSQPLDHTPMQSPNAVNHSDSADFSDVMEFANSNANIGPLSYTVIIEGIESSHLLIQLKDAMTDSRFGWNVSELMTQVGGGQLVLSGLSPAKASVLINRIKYLPLKISWRQDVLSSS